MATAQRITKSGKLYYRVQIRRPTKGIKLDEYFTTKRAADKFIRQVEHAIDTGEPISQNVQSAQKFDAAVALYLNDPAAYCTAKGRPLKPSAAKDRRNRLKWLSRECFGELALKRLDWPLIDAKLSEKSRQLNWKPASRYRYETTLSRFVEYCRLKGWVSANVVNGSNRLNDSAQRHRVYTTDEWHSLLKIADSQNNMLGMFLRLAWETGCRKSELLRLRWVDVEAIEHDQLGARLEIHDTKNHDDRVVFISKDNYRRLQEHEEAHRLESSPLIFPSRTRQGLYSPDERFRNTRAEAGLDQPDEKYGEVLTIHHIRHTWATRLGDSGASLAQLMAAGGWRTSATAMRYMKRKEHQSAQAAALLVGK